MQPLNTNSKLGGGIMKPLLLMKYLFWFTWSVWPYWTNTVAIISPLSLSLSLSSPPPPAASFSFPLLLREDAGEGDETRFLCHSRGGFPKPVVRWRINETVQPPEGSVWTDFALLPESQLYNITSLLVVNISQDVSVSCSIENPSMNETLTSTSSEYVNNLTQGFKRHENATSQIYIHPQANVFELFTVWVNTCITPYSNSFSAVFFILKMNVSLEPCSSLWPSSWSLDGVQPSPVVGRATEALWVFSTALCVVVSAMVLAALAYQIQQDRAHKDQNTEMGMFLFF